MSNRDGHITKTVQYQQLRAFSTEFVGLDFLVSRLNTANSRLRFSFSTFNCCNFRTISFNSSELTSIIVGSALDLGSSI